MAAPPCPRSGLLPHHPDTREPCPTLPAHYLTGPQTKAQFRRVSHPQVRAHAARGRAAHGGSGGQWTLSRSAAGGTAATLGQGLDTYDRAASDGQETFGTIFLSPLRKLSNDKVLSVSCAPDTHQGLCDQVVALPAPFAPLSASLICFHFWVLQALCLLGPPPPCSSVVGLKAWLPFVCLFSRGAPHIPLLPSRPRISADTRVFYLCLVFWSP